ncbi:MAG: hypothetical protein ABIA76_00670 [Candidatus Diapherotrites archaeon]
MQRKHSNSPKNLYHPEIKRFVRKALKTKRFLTMKEIAKRASDLAKQKKITCPSKASMYDRIKEYNNKNRIRSPEELQELRARIKKDKAKLPEKTKNKIIELGSIYEIETKEPKYTHEKIRKMTGTSIRTVSSILRGQGFTRIHTPSKIENAKKQIRLIQRPIIRPDLEKISATTGPSITTLLEFIRRNNIPYQSTRQPRTPERRIPWGPEREKIWNSIINAVKNYGRRWTSLYSSSTEAEKIAFQQGFEIFQYWNPEVHKSHALNYVRGGIQRYFKKQAKQQRAIRLDSQRNQFDTKDRLMHESIPSTQKDPLLGIELNEIFRKIDSAKGKFPKTKENMKNVLKLKMQGYNNAEIGKSLQLSRERIRQLLKLIQDLIKPQ